jgi:hypothetical protein
VVMEEWSYTSTHPLGHTGPVTGSLYLYLYIYTIIHTHLYIYTRTHTHTHTECCRKKYPRTNLAAASLFTLSQ